MRDYTVREAAARIGVSPGRVWQLIGEGRLVVRRKVGPLAVLSASEVDSFARLDRPAGNPGFRRKVKSA